MEKDNTISSFGLEGGEERFEINAKIFLDKINEFKSKEWNDTNHLIDIAITNSVLLEHFLLLVITSSLTDKHKEYTHYDELISAFNLYKDYILIELEKKRNTK
jgi:hypothetical protein